jgi:hypothetical protein
MVDAKEEGVGVLGFTGLRSGEFLRSSHYVFLQDRGKLFGFRSVSRR